MLMGRILASSVSEESETNMCPSEEDWYTPRGIPQCTAQFRKSQSSVVFGCGLLLERLDLKLDLAVVQGILGQLEWGQSHTPQRSTPTAQHRSQRILGPAS